MNFTKQTTRLAAALALLFTTAALTPSHGAVIITATESAGNVVFNYTGSIILTGLGSAISGTAGSNIFPSGGSFFSQGSITDNNSDMYNASISGLPSDSFGTGSLSIADSSSGSALMFAANQLRLTPGYTSGSALSGSMTFNSTTLATLGVASGSRVYTIAENSDTITMNVGSVPEPSRALLAGLGLCGLLLRRRRVRLV